MASEVQEQAQAQPDGGSSSRGPAPGALALVEAFLNSVDLESGRDALADPGELRAWLDSRGLLPEGRNDGRSWLTSQGPARPDLPLGEVDLERVREVREALRALLLANNGAPLDPRALETLNRAAGRARLVVRFDDSGGTRLEPDVGGVDAALGCLLAIVFAAMADGSWDRFKACRGDTCHWAFYDVSKNRSGAWCSMAVCGNRAKARAYRRRHAAGHAPA